jgi:hypothetical protein
MRIGTMCGFVDRLVAGLQRILGLSSDDVARDLQGSTENYNSFGNRGDSPEPRPMKKRKGANGSAVDDRPIQRVYDCAGLSGSRSPEGPEPNVGAMTSQDSPTDGGKSDQSNVEVHSDTSEDSAMEMTRESDVACSPAVDAHLNETSPTIGVVTSARALIDVETNTCETGSENIDTKYDTIKNADEVCTDECFKATLAWATEGDETCADGADMDAADDDEKDDSAWSQRSDGSESEGYVEGHEHAAVALGVIIKRVIDFDSTDHESRLSDASAGNSSTHFLGSSHDSSTRLQSGPWKDLLQGFVDDFEHLDADTQMCVVARLHQIGATKTACELWTSVTHEGISIQGMGDDGSGGDGQRAIQFLSGTITTGSSGHAESCQTGDASTGDDSNIHCDAHSA